MKKNIHTTAMALAVTLTLLNIFCLLFLIITPNLAQILFSSFMHSIDLGRIIIAPSLGMNTLIGIVVTFIGGYLIGAVFAAIYNKLE